MLKPKLYLVILLFSILALVVGACAKPAPTPQGRINVYVTDAPPREEVTSIMVTVAEVEVHRAASEREQEKQLSNSDNQTQEQEQQQTDEDGGEWISINLSENAKTFDLIKIRGIEQFLGTSDVAASKYTQVRLIIDKVQVKLGDSDLQDATVPSKELKIVRPFDVTTGENTAVVLDFEADEMVTVTGASKIIVKPVIKLTVRQEKGGGKQNGSGADKVVLEDKVWILESYGELENLIAVLADTEITATFDSTERKVTGSAGCNNYFGGYELNGVNLTIPGPIGATEMSCGEQIDKQEYEYLKTLQAAESYNIEDGKLSIICGSQVLIFDSQ